jgi:NADH-quinone oxidoreductase subunit M
MITVLILIPLVGTILVSAFPQAVARTISFLSTAFSALLALNLWRGFDPSTAALQFVERHGWIPAIGAEYFVGIDGLSLLLVLLTSLLFPFAFSAQKAGRGFCALMLLMQSALYGTFTAQNFVPWFVFYEMSLVPSFLLIKVYGGENRDRAATKFFIYTFLGSVAMLLAFLGVYQAKGSFDFSNFAAAGKAGLFQGNLRWVIFGGIFLGLAVKVPLYPFHTWLPDAYETAPTGVSMVLTGALSKMGVYGFIRLLLPLFPNEVKTLGPWLLALAVCSILLASLAAWAQSDLKRMVAYLSVNHLGYCMLGLFAVSATVASPVDGQSIFSGVFVQMFSHGITAATLFYLVGLLEQRRQSRRIDDFGGLMQSAPVLCASISVAMFSSLGLPGLNGFIGEFLIFKGSFALAASFTAIAVLGLLFTAVTFMRAMQALFSGPLSETAAAFPDLFQREKLVIIPISILMFAVGIAPQFLFTIFNRTVMQLAQIFA